MELQSSYPKNLSYSIKELNNFSCQTVRVLTDHLGNDINAGETFRVNLPAGSTLLDLRTIACQFDFTATLSGGGTGVSIHAPRYSSSLIERINIYLNNNLVSTINQYNLLYNTIADLQFSRDATSKRWLENYDPSINYIPSNTSNSFITLQRNTANGISSDTNKAMVINNWLGFLGGETSTSVIDCASLGQITLEFVLAPPTVCWISAANAVNTAIAGTPSYKISNVYFTMNKITFNSEEYYSLLSSKLLDSGLIIGYKDYYTTKSSLYTKSANPTFNYSINANSLDAIYCTVNTEKYNTLTYLQLVGSQNVGTGASADNALATPINGLTNYTFEEAISQQGYAFSSNLSYNKNPNFSNDLFNQSTYFQRNAIGLSTAQLSINSIPVDLWNKAPKFIYEEALENLGMKNLDINCGCHPGMLSLYHFLKYYFVQVVRFNNISGDSQFYKSGLAANNTPINVSYQATFDGVATDSIYLVFFNVMTKVMSINAGRIISII
jgi:hypothetical protein